MTEDEFYRSLTTENLRKRENDGKAKRELARREVRDSIRECKDYAFWNNNPFQAQKQLEQAYEKIEQYDFDVEEDFEEDISLNKKDKFSRMVSAGHIKTAEVYSKATDIEDEHVDNVIRMQAEALDNYQKGFALADLLGKDEIMEDLSEQIYESLEEESRPLFVNYLEEKDLETPGSVEEEVKEAQSSLDDKAQSIQEEISELEKELEETQSQKSSYERFLE